jgi:hypothetical protein
MNRKQKIAVVVGAVLLLLVSLFPPWLVIETTSAGAEQSNMGFRWVLDTRPPPASRGMPMVYEAGRDGFQVAIVALTIAAVVMLGRGRKEA